MTNGRRNENSGPEKKTAVPTSEVPQKVVENESESEDDIDVVDNGDDDEENVSFAIEIPKLKADMRLRRIDWCNFMMTEAQTNYFEQIELKINDEQSYKAAIISVENNSFFALSEEFVNAVNRAVPGSLKSFNVISPLNEMQLRRKVSNPDYLLLTTWMGKNCDKKNTMFGDRQRVMKHAGLSKFIFSFAQNVRSSNNHLIFDLNGKRWNCLHEPHNPFTSFEKMDIEDLLSIIINWSTCNTCVQSIIQIGQVQLFTFFFQNLENHNWSLLPDDFEIREPFSSNARDSFYFDGEALGMVFDRISSSKKKTIFKLLQEALPDNAHKHLCIAENFKLVLSSDGKFTSHYRSVMEKSNNEENNKAEPNQKLSRSTVVERFVGIENQNELGDNGNRNPSQEREVVERMDMEISMDGSVAKKSESLKSVDFTNSSDGKGKESESGTMKNANSIADDVHAEVDEESERRKRKSKSAAADDSIVNSSEPKSDGGSSSTEREKSQMRSRTQSTLSNETVGDPEFGYVSYDSGSDDSFDEMAPSTSAACFEPVNDLEGASGNIVRAADESDDSDIMAQLIALRNDRDEEKRLHRMVETPYYPAPCQRLIFLSPNSSNSDGSEQSFSAINDANRANDRNAESGSIPTTSENAAVRAPVEMILVGKAVSDIELRRLSKKEEVNVTPRKARSLIKRSSISTELEMELDERKRKRRDQVDVEVPASDDRNEMEVDNDKETLQ